MIEPNEISTSTSRACCYANTAECLSCGAGMSIDEYCRIYPSTIGCEGLFIFKMVLDILILL